MHGRGNDVAVPARTMVDARQLAPQRAGRRGTYDGVLVAVTTSAAAAATNAQCCSCAPKVDARRAAELEARSRELLAAAEAGDADALCEVGLVLMSNAVRKTEQKRAFGYLKQASEIHHARALRALGRCSQVGLGAYKGQADEVR